MKRFIDSDWYNQDWFLNLNPTYRDFWFFIFTSCDCAGIWTPSVTRYQLLSGVEINFKDFLKHINSDKERIVKLKNGNYFIRNFIPFQYTKSKLRLNILKNTAHLGVYRCLIQNQVDINLIEPQIEIIEEISKRPPEDDSEGSPRDLDEDSKSYKDMDKDKVTDKEKDSQKEKEEKKEIESHLWDGIAQNLHKMNFNELPRELQQNIEENFIKRNKVPF